MTAVSHMRLEVISGNATGTSITVEDELVIGRHADGPGRLSDDEELSRQHARVSRERTGDYAIEDLGSSNGTFVNGLQIQSPRLLSVGDSIETGATTLVVREIVEPEPPAPEPPAPGEPPDPAMMSAPTVFGRVPDQPDALAEDERTGVPDPPAAQAEDAGASAPDQQDARAEDAGAGAGAPDQPDAQAEDAGAGASAPDQPDAQAEDAGAGAGAPDQPDAQATGQDTSSPAEAPPRAPARGGVPAPTLHLQVDFDAREARLSLGEGAETIRLVFEDGRWRSDGAAGGGGG
jgi:hypothetical protein